MRRCKVATNISLRSPSIPSPPTPTLTSSLYIGDFPDKTTVPFPFKTVTYTTEPAPAMSTLSTERRWPLLRASDGSTIPRQINQIAPMIAGRISRETSSKGQRWLLAHMESDQRKVWYERISWSLISIVSSSESLLSLVWSYSSFLVAFKKSLFAILIQATCSFPNLFLCIIPEYL